MRCCTSTLIALLVAVLLLAQTTDAQSRRLRLRTRPAVQPASVEDDVSIEDDSVLNDDYDAQPQQQYYTPEPPALRQTPTSRYVSSSDDYNGLYGQPTAATPRQRIDYQRPAAQTPAPKPKENQTKAPPVQTIRNYNKVNDDGSFTFGYEAADGSFKEETRGTDCVVRGKYGYVDPDGNKREFTYVSGNPCDPSHPDETADEEPERNANSAEDPNEPENIPQNYPRRPIKPIARPQPQYVARPLPTTTAAPPTTVFQNNYASNAYAAANSDEDEDEQPDTIQLLQPQQRRPQYVQARPQDEIAIRQRPRLTIANTTPSPISAFLTPTRPVQPVSITPRPTYRVPQQSLQTQPPATTYRPAVQFVTQKPAAQLHAQTINYSQKPTASPLSVEPLTVKSTYASPRKPIDFAVEFQKFQQQHNVLQPSSTQRVQLPTQPTQRPFKASPVHNVAQPTSNPIYESQLVFDPSTGQYDSNLFQQLPHADGDFSLSNRHQPYVQLAQQPAPYNPQPAHLVSLQQLQNAAAPLYQRPLQQPTRSPLQFQPTPSVQPQFSQQLYHKEQENNQVFSSQQLFAQQQELQQHQLHQDRLIAASKQRQQTHRFQQPAQQQQQAQQQYQPQGFYYVQPPPQASGQIDAFLRGHNIDF